MVSIEKRSSNTYRITVSAGYDSSGKKLRKHRSISLAEGMTERQREKELNRQAILFEQEVENGTFLDGEKITFAEFAKMWVRDYAEKHLAPGTLNPYKTRLEKRILPALGHVKLAKLQPHHLMEFYDNLTEEGVRLDVHYTATAALLALLDAKSIPEIVKLTGLTYKTCQRIKNGNPTTQNAADKVCATLNGTMKSFFVASGGGKDKLSDKTIRHHHGLISTILATAVKWNLITSNPADRVKLGRMPKYKAAYYDDEQVAVMIAALEDEPLRYKAMVYLTLDTGMRTGEITGLQ